ncbi:pentapeptide repeat-containing protein [Maricaulis maris]|uniref:pentapeptide repeat-containing protein n=1 Tax=Maricaulis maris TaxID=74318 RepID=UPI003A922E54
MPAACRGEGAGAVGNHPHFSRAHFSRAHFSRAHFSRAHFSRAKTRDQRMLPAGS